MVGFLEFNSIHWKKSDPACAENRVRHCFVEFLEFNSIHLKKKSLITLVVVAFTSNYFTIIQLQLLDNGLVISTNQCLYLSKAELMIH